MSDYCPTPGKAKYCTPREARLAVNDSPHQKAYLCKCGHYHLATRGAKKRKPFRAGVRLYYRPTTRWKAGEA